MEDEPRGWNTVSRKAERLVLNFLSEGAKEERGKRGRKRFWRVL